MTRLSAVLEQVKAQQAAYPTRQRRGPLPGSDRRTTSRRRVWREGAGTTSRYCRGSGLRQRTGRGP